MLTDLANTAIDPLCALCATVASASAWLVALCGLFT